MNIQNEKEPSAILSDEILHFKAEVWADAAVQWSPINGNLSCVKRGLRDASNEFWVSISYNLTCLQAGEISAHSGRDRNNQFCVVKVRISAL